MSDMQKEESPCESNECCCKCRFQVEITKHPWNNEPYKGSILDRIGWGCTAFRESNDHEPTIVFSDREHGLCECFIQRKKEQVNHV